MDDTIFFEEFWFEEWTIRGGSKNLGPRNGRYDIVRGILVRGTDDTIFFEEL